MNSDNTTIKGPKKTKERSRDSSLILSLISDGEVVKTLKFPLWIKSSVCDRDIEKSRFETVFYMYFRLISHDSEQRRDPKGSIPQLAKRKRDEEGEGGDQPAISAKRPRTKKQTQQSDEEAVKEMCKKIEDGTISMDLQIQLINALMKR